MAKSTKKNRLGIGLETTQGLDAIFGNNLTDLIEDILPKNRLNIRIKMVDENTRQFVITPHGSKYEDLCERVL